MKRSLYQLCASILIGATMAASAMAQQYPARPITMIVPVPPGGGTDYLARLLAGKLAIELGTSVVVENKPGAGGNIGTDSVAKARPDGYTLLVGFGAPLTTNVTLFGSALPYNPETDLSPVAMVATSPEFLFVNPKIPAKTVAELERLIVSDARTYGSFGSGGTGTVMHLAGELMKARKQLPMTHVAYKGGGPAASDVVAGHLPMFFGTSTAMKLAEAGRLNVLAVTSPNRSPIAPEVPTLAEQGYPGFDLVAWYCVMAPAGTPAPIVDVLQKAIRSVLESPTVKQDLMANGMTAAFGGPQELAAKIKSEIPLMKDLIKSAGIVR
ncbi:tripartite tricarboxylate transporter substrate-binding protein [Comamonadaceae bacterium G21597-S1]|nr:tripartite tricarboxylate transporter substrate-binding protein [Comamonadaceae bacterium G21597-S1]